MRNQGALTAEQRAALGRYRARWLAIRRSTEPADRDAAEQGAGLAYQAAGLQPPARFVWCDSPVALSHLAARPSPADGANVRSALIDRIRRQAARQVRKRIGARRTAEIAATVNPADALIATVAELVLAHVADDDASLMQRYRRSEPLSRADLWRTLLGREGFAHVAAGPHDLSWLGPFEYVRNVLGLRAETSSLLGLWQVALHAGWIRPHEQTCWLSERPHLLHGDVNDRLHHASGPALRFGDGFAVWAWRGVEVPRALIEQPGAITAATIDAATNVQHRRCMIEIMTPERYVVEGGAVRVAEDQTGVLWRKRWPPHDVWAAVEVINATAEADGTHKHYFLQVPPELRTPCEAVAWTYGMEAKAYSKLVART
ncbi:MAG: hypothetical protein JOY90_34930 [Bradyrhizobium sp.]|uniref:DUF6745 domain-containing protein n=1 Tax=Bradyrhizobium sp. TaxID=376 RepID=UPI001D82EE0E|nr:hypothetical protein [Bradyrhizobium sp.]MBV9565609.1 hypothetical protein [Bradyrhizobium sp.]